jgi:hypothetical protein
VPVYIGIGHGAHEGAAFSLKEKISHTTPPLNDVEEISISAFRKEIEIGVEYDNASSSQNKAENQLRQICKTYFHLILPNQNPIAVERKLNAETPDFVLTGHPDAIETTTISDLKTGASGSCYEAQMGAYSLLSRSNGYEKPSSLIIHHIPRSKATEPKLYHYDVETCEAIAFRTAKNLVRDLNNFISSGDPMVIAENTRSQTCGRKYCSSFGTDFCPITKRR